jgi:hypothetical protein
MRQLIESITILFIINLKILKVMSNKTIPASDHEFDVAQNRITTQALNNIGQYGLNPIWMAETLTPAKIRWTNAWSAYISPIMERTHSIILEKNEAKANYEPSLEQLVNMLKASPTVTQVDLELMGIHIPDKTRTPAPPIHVRGKVEVDFKNVQEHTIIVRDIETRSSARPPHARGFQICRKIGDDAPVNDEDWTLVAEAPHSPYTLTYNQSQSGQRVYYRVRWMNTRGIPGPWSEPVSAVIA